MFEVYCIASLSGKRYVGLTSKDADWRWSLHVKSAKRGSKLPLHCAIRKYGPESFTRSLLERMTTEAGAKRAEQLWIKELGTFGRGGYNATLGGEGAQGYVHSPEARVKMSAPKSAQARARMSKAKLNMSAETRAKMADVASKRSFTPERRAKMAASASGKAHSPETRAKMSAAKIGKKQSPETCAKRSASLRLSWAKRKELSTNG